MQEAASESVINATLGALLHDIGKIIVRAPAASRPQTRALGCDSRHEGGWRNCAFCGRFVFAHAIVGSRVASDSLGEKTFGHLAELVLYHHVPRGSPAQRDLGETLDFIQHGDRASANERDESADHEEPLPGTAAGHRPLLLNPFTADSSAVEIAPVPLSTEAMLGSPRQGEVSSDYEALTTRLKESIEAASRYADTADGKLALVDHILGAMEYSAAFAPAAFYRDVADIALAAHLHTSGAFAGAFAADRIGAGTGELPGGPVAALVMGDLTGIQTFVHQVASKRAARSLRARSFYLSVLSLIVSRHVALRLGVTAANVIHSSGGNFTIIGPASGLGALKQVSDKIEEAIATHHGASLGVVLAGVPVRKEQFASLSEVRSVAAGELSTAKGRRFSSAGAELFNAKGDGGPARACAACGSDVEGAKPGDEDRVCKMCEAFEDLGKRLPNMDYLTIERAASEPAAPGETWAALFRQLGYTVRLHEKMPQPPFHGAIYAFSAHLLQALPCARLLPVARRVPTDGAGAPLDFNWIASRASGRQLLAVLKADVDDLGRVLSERAKKGSDTPSRMLTFSRLLALFFEGRVNDLADREFNDIYLVFAGGDDLLAIGPWDRVLEFATRLRSEFAAWTGQNPAYHFSAGIAFVGARQPVRMAVEEAESLLARAKQREGKNAVALLGRVLRWDDLVEVIALQKEFVQKVAGPDSDLPRNLLQVIQELFDYAPEDVALSAPYGPWVWRTRYYLNREGERNPGQQGFLDGVYRDWLLKPGSLLKLTIAARLAKWATSSSASEEETVT